MTGQPPPPPSPRRRCVAVGRSGPAYTAQVVDMLEAAVELLERIAGQAGWLVAGSYTDSARVDAVIRRARTLTASHHRRAA